METTKTQTTQQQQLMKPTTKRTTKTPMPAATIRKLMMYLRTTVAAVMIPQVNLTDHLIAIIAAMIPRTVAVTHQAKMTIVRRTVATAVRTLRIKLGMTLRMLQIIVMTALPVAAIVMILQTSRMAVHLIATAAIIMIIVNLAMIVAIIWSLKTTRLRGKA